MPLTTVCFYQEAPGDVPVLDWLRELRNTDRRAFANCVAKIRLLAAFGHSLRRPHADALRDGIRELRARSGNVNYRILYFAHGRQVAVLAHALTKEAAVSNADVERAIVRKRRFESDPTRHTAEVDYPDA